MAYDLFRLEAAMWKIPESDTEAMGGHTQHFN